MFQVIGVLTFFNLKVQSQLPKMYELHIIATVPLLHRLV